jgi:lysozyme
MDVVTQIRQDEGVRRFPYTDTVGKTSIGVGRNLTDVGLSDTEIDFLLQNDIKAVEDTLKLRLPWFPALNEVRQAVLINMTFNIGFNRLDQFPAMLTAIARGTWDLAAQEMLDSIWAKQVGARALRLAQQMRTGVWYET